MLNRDKLDEILSSYKKRFKELFNGKSKNDGEKYKWVAVKRFQDVWDINAPDFLDMFMKATDKTFNLLASMNNLPRGMIKEFATKDPEAVREMFINLYDESKDVTERIRAFSAAADEIKDKYNPGSWQQHYQGVNAISTYLWLRYPDKYYIYKYSEISKATKITESDFIAKKGYALENFVPGLSFYGEICKAISEDTELVQMLKDEIDDTCYPDEKFMTMAIDVGFYISRYYEDDISGKNEWHPKDYNPGISKELWLDLLKNETVFTKSSLEIMYRLKDIGGAATCTELAEKYGETKNFYNAGSSSLARRVAKETCCPLMQEDTEDSKWWPVLYVGKYADKDAKGRFIWKLRDELSDALDEYEFNGVALYAQKDESKMGCNYWWLNANPKIWSYSNIAVGEEQDYTLYNENGNKRRIFKNFLEAKAGDIVIGYEAVPVKQIVALAKITRENDGERLYFEKTESLATPIDYATVKECPELAEMEFFTNPNGSLFKLDKDEYNAILDIIREENPVVKADNIDLYTKEDFLNDVYISSEKYDSLVSLLNHKLNVILQGAPGVGKTYAAKRLAYSIMGKKDDSKIEFVQFHQNYSYEDFIMGYKPNGDSFKLTNGIFYNFCKKAESNPNEKYFFIIDEINRGNMSKIFGELLMLIEKDYRGTKATLAYNGLPFSVPENLYIIGMMNTADRSLAMIDYALRRRFSFCDMEPGFTSDGFVKYQKSFENETLDALVDKVKELNTAISKDSALGKGFCIGHSYFCGHENETDDNWLSEIVEYDIIPMISEYWFDDNDKLLTWKNNLRGVLND